MGGPGPPLWGKHHVDETHRAATCVHITAGPAHAMLALTIPGTRYVCIAFVHDANLLALAALHCTDGGQSVTPGSLLQQLA